MDAENNSNNEEIASAIGEELYQASVKPTARSINVRKKYLEIAEKIKKTYDESGEGGSTTEQLEDHIKQINENFKDVKIVSEANMDMKLLKQVTLMGKANIEKTQSSFLTFRPLEFADHLEESLEEGDSLEDIFQHNSSSLKSLACSLMKLSNSTYGFEPLYGSVDWQPPAKQPKSRLPEKHASKVTRSGIEQVQAGSSTAPEETQVAELGRVRRVLREACRANGGQGVHLMRFVIDPNCFSTSVANLFHVTFLLRDQHANLYFDEDDLPCIVPGKGMAAKDAGCISESRLRQDVLEMNVHLWQNFIKVLNIKEPLIPNLNV